MEIGKGSADNVTADGFVEFLSSGQRATGEYHCAECGYGVTIFAVLPLCPMCGGGPGSSPAGARSPGRRKRAS